jgi:molybdopterin converting factor subunit 1
VKEWVGRREETLELPEGTTVEELRRRVLVAHRRLENVEQVLVAVNGSFADLRMVIVEGDEVALFPPVSGG